MSYLGVGLLGSILLVIAICLYLGKANWLMGGYVQAFGDKVSGTILHKIQKALGHLFVFLAVMLFALATLGYAKQVGQVSEFVVNIGQIIIGITIVAGSFLWLKRLNVTYHLNTPTSQSRQHPIRKKKSAKIR